MHDYCGKQDSTSGRVPQTQLHKVIAKTGAYGWLHYLLTQSQQQGRKAMGTCTCTCRLQRASTKQQQTPVLWVSGEEEA